MNNPLMKTRILEVAKKQFNQHGVANVTIRRIAQELKISSGHFNYHFKTRADLLLALFDCWLEEKLELDNLFLQLEEPSINHKNIVLESLTLLSSYRFFWTDTLQVIREQKKLKNLLPQQGILMMKRIVDLSPQQMSANSIQSLEKILWNNYIEEISNCILEGKKVGPRIIRQHAHQISKVIAA